MNAALPHPDFSHFYRHDDLLELLATYAAARPQLVERIVIGRSHEGREIVLMALTNQATGRHADKPALWVDGNIHAAELLASTAVLYYLHQLLSSYGSDAAVTQLLDTRTLYLVPRLNPDGAELALADRPRHIRSSTRRYPWDELPVDGLTPEDVDGDGRILSMRIPDPHGGWKAHPEEPRLLTPREPGEFGGQYYRVMPEGFIQNHDGVMVTVNANPEGLDLNRNFPEAWRPEPEQLGAGPYPASEPEVRACVDFVAKHPNIGAAISYHTHSGVILRPSGLKSDDDLPAEDLWQLKKFSELGTQHTGYPAISVWHEFKYHPKEHISGTQSYFYELLGAMHWVVELWSPNREAGIQGYKWIDWYRQHPAEDDRKLLAWSDTLGPDSAFVNWRPFQHPQLGAVEIGGWDLMNFWRNPPPALRQAEVERFPGWMNQLALSLPRLELLQVRATALGDETWRVRMAVANAGYLGTVVTEQARAKAMLRGVVFEMHLPVGDPHVALISGSPRQVGPQLAGHAPKSSLHHFVPSREVTADRAVVEWLLRAPRGTRLTLSAQHDRAGRVQTELTLD
ncbi:M14 family metallopeptidase [Inhella sp.]|uniref:M14 family metallopeptidase n=1 Tax=Inhella sp. TaxID=1921806 RepID=UPI0035B03B18